MDQDWGVGKKAELVMTVSPRGAAEVQSTKDVAQRDVNTRWVEGRNVDHGKGLVGLEVKKTQSLGSDLGFGLCRQTGLGLNSAHIIYEACDLQPVI